MPPLQILSAALFLFLLVSCNAFTFSFTAPTQCDQFSVTWSGGTGPFNLLLLPVFDTPRSIDIPAAATTSFSLQLPLEAGQSFVVVLSDRSGFASGGISSVLTVGSSIGKTACSTTTPPIPFLFDLPNNLNQCQPFSFTWDDTAAEPVTITGVVPSGNFVQLKAGPTDDAFTWNPATVQAGTTMLFFLQDSQGNFGGTSQLISVGNGDSNSCLNAQSPQSTASNGTPSSTTSISASGTKPTTPGSSSPTHGSLPGETSSSDHSDKPKSSLSGGAIGGIAAGGVLALVAVGLVVYFFCIRKRNKKDGNTYDGYSYDYLKPTPFNISASPLPSDSDTPQHGQENGQQYPSLPQSASSQSYTPTTTTQVLSNSNSLAYSQPGPHNPVVYHPSLGYNTSPQQRSNYTGPLQPHFPAQQTSQQQHVVPYPSTSPAASSIPATTSYVPPSVLLAQRQTGEGNASPAQYVMQSPRSASPYSQNARPPPGRYLQPSTQPPVRRAQPASPHVIQHTDAEDNIVVELPPQYNPHRGPSTELGSSTAAASDSMRSEKS